MTPKEQKQFDDLLRGEIIPSAECVMTFHELEYRLRILSHVYDARPFNTSLDSQIFHATIVEAARKMCMEYLYYTSGITTENARRLFMQDELKEVEEVVEQETSEEPSEETEEEETEEETDETEEETSEDEEVLPN